MSEPAPRHWEIFLEVFEALPRQGPGSRASTARALKLCGDLPPSPSVLDLGCGTGAQTLHLAELTSGCIVAIDSHAPSIERLCQTVTDLGLANRVFPRVGDIAHPQEPPESFDLVWSEGALYNLGLERALPICRDMLRPRAYLGFTDAIWRKQSPPPEVRAMFEDYPTMGTVGDALGVIAQSGLSTVGHFTLPHEAWWDDFYAPMERRIETLRTTYAGAPNALAALEEVAQEPEIHRRHSAYYAYEFFVARR